jgi:hypothetical protein
MQGGWTIPEVLRSRGASGLRSACQKSTPGKYSPKCGSKTIWGKKPFFHWLSNRWVNSLMARLILFLAPIALFLRLRRPIQVHLGSGANNYIGTRPGFGPFEEVLEQVAQYWCVLNEPPPTL